MNNRDKQALAHELLFRASSLIEFWDELRPPELEHIESSEAAEQLTKWLKNLPGDNWVYNLPKP